MSMTYENGPGNVFAKINAVPTSWKRYQSTSPQSTSPPICSIQFGCNEFTNPSSPVLVINTNCHDFSCEGERQIVDLSGKTECSIAVDQLQFLYDDHWKQLPFIQKIFEISYRKNLKGTVLKWDLTKAPRNWINKVIKLSFYCAKSPKIIRCVVIKLKWSSDYNTTASSTLRPTANSTTFPKTLHPTSTFRTLYPKPTSKTASPTYISTPSTSINGKVEQKGESSNVVGIVVGLLVAALVLCVLIVGFLIYKKRSRMDVKTSSNVDIHSKGQSSGNSLNPIYCSADTSKSSLVLNNGGNYQEPALGASQECDLYEAGDDHEYDYAKVEQRNKPAPLSHELDYVYAKNDDTRSAVQRIPARSNDYHTTNTKSDG